MDRYADFREFVQSRGAALSRAAYVLTGDHWAAEELLQDALARTVAHWRRVAAGGRPEAYVRRVMLNRMRSVWRGPGRRSHPTAEPPERPVDADQSGRSDDRLVLAAALRGLPPRQRAVLYLRFYEDLSEREAAEALGCSLGTVKRQTHDALARLRRSAPELAPVADPDRS